MNKFIGLGNLTKDPSRRQTQNGNVVCEFCIAINNKLNNSVFFIDIESWGNIAENCNRFLSKGRKVLVEGKLLTNTWKNKNGETRTKIFCRADFVNFLDKSENIQQEKVAEKVAEKKAREIIEEDEFADIPF